MGSEGQCAFLDSWGAATYAYKTDFLTRDVNATAGIAWETRGKLIGRGVRFACYHYCSCNAGCLLY